MDEFLNNKEVMSLLKITSLQTLKKRVDNEGLKVSYGEGRKRRFKKQDVLDFLGGVNRG